MFDRQQYDRECYHPKNLYCNTTEHVTTKIRIVYNSKTDFISFGCAIFQKSSGYSGTSKTNKSCPQYLGVTVAETVLSKVFNNVERMAYGNKGFDFICNKGYKIDVKSATVGEKRKAWFFNIKRNMNADYFLCLAFDNRKTFNPMHVWLIPSDKVCALNAFRISYSTLNKWSKYELSNKIDDIITCCDVMKRD